ncbi:MAG TPA: phosphoenolpyruvate--protein phosphotransferase [Pirellulales bacterium]|nr:phosphoenolpyruvate--protein phosphotransferase [Pirellulales bacterium]
MESPSPTLSNFGPSAAVLSGRNISPGLGMGRAWIVADVLKWGSPTTRVDAGDVRRELARLAESFEKTLAQLDEYARRIEAEFDRALAGIFRAHGDMLRELFDSGEFEHELKASRIIAEEAVRRVLLRWYKKFAAVENPTLRQRADDVLDLGRSMIRRLRGEHDSGFAAMPAHSVLVSERLLPSDVVSLPKSHVAAVVVEALGQGSHAALLLREKGIPAITDIPGILSRIAGETELLVDGYRGTLVIGPTADTRAEFQTRVEKWRATLVHCKAACLEPAHTLDGQLIRVEANIGLQDDVEVALENGADGVGLLRIEQLYFARPSPPTEDELHRELKSLVAPLGNRTVTVRLLDIGGDKPLSYLGLTATANPVLGRRGVRLLLDYAQLARTQIGALVRLAAEHSLRVLVPMVTLEDDIRRMRETFDAIVAERAVGKPPPFGAMVETPAAALEIAEIGRHVDFFCIGTNDLTQYTLAAARDDASVSDYYLDGHESIMRLLSIIVSESGGRPVTVCGELAGREAFIPQLLKMGYRGLSVAPTLIPTTKALIRKLDLTATNGATRRP